MQKISFIKSLMEFQKRVLTQGSINLDDNYSLEELKQILFFNQVFINNTDEMFQKFNMNEVIDDYSEYLQEYSSNMNIIKEHIQYNTNSKIYNIFNVNNSTFEKRLELDKILPGQVITKFYKSIKDASTYRFLNGNIYYISLLKNGSIGISFIDMRQSVYKSLIKVDYEDATVYWKTDESIREYISLQYPIVNVITVKVTTSTKSGNITKVEYNGNTNFMNYISNIFDDNVFIMKNLYLYSEDIGMIINDNIKSTPVINKSEYREISIEKLFKNELLIEYPNDSFDIYLDFLSTVSRYENTKSIYITLYRIGKDPAIFYILKDAISNGINVTVNLEMYASGEDINKTWLREMIKAGIKVNTYAAGELKVHSKLTLVEFHSGKMISQIGTGNYHTKTTTQYTDFSFITSDNDICNQVKNVFKIFDHEFGDEPKFDFNERLLVTRYNARRELINLIDDEGSKGKNGCIVMKCNSLDDDDIIYHLNEAANNGCMINLIIRGVCTWIPEVPNARIKSIVWDKLEHSRVYSFGNKNPKIYLGSLDLVTKKMDKRIETLVRIDNPKIINKLCEYINKYITTTTGSWIQTSSGMYIKE